MNIYFAVISTTWNITYCINIKEYFVLPAVTGHSKCNNLRNNANLLSCSKEFEVCMFNCLVFISHYLNNSHFDNFQWNCSYNKTKIIGNNLGIKIFYKIYFLNSQFFVKNSNILSKNISHKFIFRKEIEHFWFYYK